MHSYRSQRDTSSAFRSDSIAHSFFTRLSSSSPVILSNSTARGSISIHRTSTWSPKCNRLLAFLDLGTCSEAFRIGTSRYRSFQPWGARKRGAGMLTAKGARLEPSLRQFRGPQRRVLAAGAKICPSRPFTSLSVISRQQARKSAISRATRYGSPRRPRWSWPGSASTRAPGSTAAKARMESW